MHTTAHSLYTTYMHYAYYTQPIHNIYAYYTQPIHNICILHTAYTQHRLTSSLEFLAFVTCSPMWFSLVSNLNLFI